MLSFAGSAADEDEVDEGEVDEDEVGEDEVDEELWRFLTIWLPLSSLMDCLERLLDDPPLEMMPSAA